MEGRKVSREAELVSLAWRIIDRGEYQLQHWYNDGDVESGPSGGSLPAFLATEPGPGYDEGDSVQLTQNGSVIIEWDADGGTDLVYNSAGGSSRSARALGRYMREVGNAGGDPHEAALREADRRRAQERAQRLEDQAQAAREEGDLKGPEGAEDLEAAAQAAREDAELNRLQRNAGVPGVPVRTPGGDATVVEGATVVHVDSADDLDQRCVVTGVSEDGVELVGPGPEGVGVERFSRVASGDLRVTDRLPREDVRHAARLERS